MPVTIDVPTLARRMRVDLPMTADDPPVPDTTSTIYLDLGDLLESYTAEVTKYANAGTPSVAMNTAVARAVGYAYDSPPAYRDTQYGRVLLNSGAVNALNQWRDATGRGTPSPDVPTDQPDAAVPESTVQTPFDAMALHDAIAAYLAENPAEKGDKGDKGDDSTVPGPRGAASTIPGPRGLNSMVPGPRGFPGDDSTVAGPRGLRGPGPTDAALASAVAAYIAANPTGGDGVGVGGGATRTVLYEGTHNTGNVFTKLTPGGDPIVCPATGTIEIYLRAAGGNREGAVASCTMPAADLRAAFHPLGGTPGDDVQTNRSLPLGANRFVAIAVEAGSHHIMLASQRTDSGGNYLARITHIAE